MEDGIVLYVSQRFYTSVKGFTYNFPTDFPKKITWHQLSVNSINNHLNTYIFDNLILMTIILMIPIL